MSREGLADKSTCGLTFPGEKDRKRAAPGRPAQRHGAASAQAFGAVRARPGRGREASRETGEARQELRKCPDLVVLSASEALRTKGVAVNEHDSEAFLLSAPHLGAAALTGWPAGWREWHTEVLRGTEERSWLSAVASPNKCPSQFISFLFKNFTIQQDFTKENKKLFARLIR